MIEVTCAIIKKGNKVLVTQRSAQMDHPLQWEFPGGKMRMGESPEKCIKREIREELNVLVKVEQLLPSVMHHYAAHDPVKLIPFVCTIQEGEPQLSEHSDMRWLDCHELESLDMLEADVEILQRLQGCQVWTCP